MEPKDDYSELTSLLQEQGYSIEDIGKILERVRRYEREMQLDSVMDSIGNGRLSLNGIIKEALEECESLREVEMLTGVNRLSLARFLNGEQSLRLDNADRLAEFFGIEHRMKRR